MSSGIIDTDSMDATSAIRKSTGRVWCDGCYDMTHFGHSNSLRQAKALGHELYVGVHSDEEIGEHKGCPPVLTEDERYTMVRAIRWVDRVVEKAPYMTTIEILQQNDCHFCAHGDDTSTNAEGEDTYQKVIDAGKYKVYERTRGVSTTGLINRILKARDRDCCNCNGSVEPHSHHHSSAGDYKESECHVENCGDHNSTEKPATDTSSPYTGDPSSSAIDFESLQRLFSEGMQPPKEGDKIVYAPGTFDLLHPGHLAFLEEAGKQGDYLIVGLYSDETVKKYKGYYPIMSLQERYLSVLAMKNVSDVKMDVPYIVTEEYLQNYNIGVVAYGKPLKTSESPHFKEPFAELRGERFLVQVESSCKLTTNDVIKRITNNRKVFADRNAKKEKKELKIISETKEVNNNLIH